MCHKCVHDRYVSLQAFALARSGGIPFMCSILRAFLIEEQKIVKKVAMVKAQQKKEEAKKAAKKTHKKSAKKTGKK